MTVATAAAVGVVAAYVQWIRERLAEEPGRRLPGPDREMVVMAPIGLGAVVVGLVFWSFWAGAGFALIALSMRGFAIQIVRALRAWRRRQPVKPEDRQRRIAERAARRRLRAGGMGRYGPKPESGWRDSSGNLNVPDGSA